MEFLSEYRYGMNKPACETQARDLHQQNSKHLAGLNDVSIII